MNYPPLETDPRTPKQLQDWLERREQIAPGQPLSARESLMIERLRRNRQPYSVM